MRKLLYCLILMSAVANSGLFVPMLAATNNGESSSRLHSSASTDRPESGVPLWIDCHYNSGEMRFDAPETFNDVEVVITELNCHYNSGEMRFDAPETFNDVEVVITELKTGRSLNI